MNCCVPPAQTSSGRAHRDAMSVWFTVTFTLLVAVSPVGVRIVTVKA